MRFTRSFLTVALLAITVAGLGSFAWGLEDGCIENLKSDLKRQDLAKAIGLTYYTERPPGITRKVKSRKVMKKITDSEGITRKKEIVVYDIQYFKPNGKLVKDEATLERIADLGIPPAYTDVWISMNTESHILAIGYDVRGRPQYAYHPLWTEASAATKFIRMNKFGKQIVNIRKVTNADLRSRGLGKRKLLAAASIILETGNIRVGSVKYMRENKSYGLTTLLDRHVKVEGATIYFDFIGKESIRHKFSIVNPRVAAVIEELLQNRGQRLFEYVDEENILRYIDANDIEEYIQEISGGEVFTAKDFRTWEGTTAAAKKLMELGPAQNTDEVEANVKAAILYASQRLRNEPKSARDSYIYPILFEAYREGDRFQSILRWLSKNSDAAGFEPEERFILELLRRK